MTKLSDILRSAADRAPIDDSEISVSAANRRVRLNRTIRGATNGAAGLGVAALVFVGIVNPTVSPEASVDAIAFDGGAEAQEAAPDAPLSADFSGDERVATEPAAAWGTCGTSALANDYGNSAYVSLSTAPLERETVDGGDQLAVPVTARALTSAELQTSGLEVVVLWNNVVVGYASGPDQVTQLSVSEGETWEQSAAIELISCFDGEPLPPSKYELLVAQALWESSPEPAPQPTPTIVSEPDPTATNGQDPQPFLSMSPADSAFADAEAQGSAEVAESPEIYPTEPWWPDRAVAEPIGFVVAGDPVDNPFGDYIPEPWEPPAKPDDALTPAIARGLFAASATDQPWSMAAGTSRWLLTSDSQSISRDGDSAGAYFGCTWEDGQTTTFPSRSAELDLLDVDIDVPSRLNVSYGWVVDDNPEVNIGVTNRSSYTFTGVHGHINRGFYLVKNGEVVAEAWLTDLDRYAEERMFLDGAEDIDTDYWGGFAPGDELSGTYLWRDLNGCWTGTTPQAIAPGTYTLLSSQSFYIEESSGGYGVAVPELAILEESPIVSSDSTGGDIDPIGDAEEPLILDEPATSSILPRDDEYWADYDSVSLQMWTSHGTVTITTN